VNTCCSTVVLGVLALIVPGPALAAKRPLPPTLNLTHVSPSPSPGVAGALETITISGVGKCGTFDFDLGDATPLCICPVISRLLSTTPIRNLGLTR
jgi:hypothetical protein